MITTKNKKLPHINNLSLVKMAGIRKIVVMEILPTVLKLSYVRLKRKHDVLDLNTLQYLASEIFIIDDSLQDVEQKLRLFIQKNNIQTRHIIVGINDFRYKNLKVLNDTEDIGEWFEEHRDKYLPRGRSHEEFIYSYRAVKEDEEWINYSVVIARANYINRIIRLCDRMNLSILSISPFALSIHFTDYAVEKNLIYIDLTSNKIIYSLSDSSGGLIYGDLYAEIRGASPQLSKLELDYDNLCIGLAEMKQTVFPVKENYLPEAYQIFVSGFESEADKIKEAVKTIFNLDCVSLGRDKHSLEFLGSYFTLNTIYSDYDHCFNMLTKSYRDINRESMEKELSLKTILMSGFFLILFLILLYIGEGFLSGRVTESQDKLSDIMAVNKLTQKYDNENDFLKANLVELKGIRNNRISYTRLLDNFISLVSDSSCLTKINVEDNARESVKVELSGLAFTQSEVANIMKRIESRDKFGKVDLIFADRLEDGEMKDLAFRSKNNNLINFKLVSEYYAY